MFAGEEGITSSGRVSTKSATLDCSRFSQNKALHMNGCQNYDSSLGTVNDRCHINIITGIQKGTILLTTTQIARRATQRASPD